MGTVYVFFTDGFEEIEALTSIDVLRRAGHKVVMVTLNEVEVARGAHGVLVFCNFIFDECNFSDADLLLLPGGMPGAENLSNHAGLNKLVFDFVTAGKPVAAICAAPMVLGKMGLLKGKKVTCYPGFEQYLEGAECTGNQVEKDGNIITGKGPGAAMDFALAVVELLTGKDKVAELEEAMCIKR